MGYDTPEHAFGLALPFDTDDREFMRGVEIGMVWTELLGTSAPVVATMHASNAEMALRMAESTGRAVRTLDIDETWFEVSFGAAH